MSNRHQGGFSLLEIMIVVFIIGFGIGIASLAFQPSDDKARLIEEVEHFYVSAHYASEQSVLSSEVIGLFVNPRPLTTTTGMEWCYDWRRFRDDAWVRLIDLLTERCLPEAIQLDMIVEGEPYEYDETLTTPLPLLVFYPSGEAIAFEIAFFDTALQGSNDIQRIEIDLFGQVLWRNRLEEAATQ
jgi:general secretion pathway protein H